MEYTLSKVNKMGEPDPKFGQGWWATVNEDLKPIMFNTLDGDFQAGDKITYEVSENKRSAKGTDYLRLKKVKRVGSVIEQPSDGSKKAQNGFLGEDSAQLQRIEDKVDAILERLQGL